MFEKLVTVLSLKFNGLRRKISFEPTIVIKEGKIIFNNLRKIGYAIDDILMLLRQKDIFDIGKVEYAVVEANGKISVLKKPEFETVTVTDMKVSPSPSKPPITIIVDGRFQTDNIQILKATEQEILKKLDRQGFSNPKEIFYATMDSEGTLNISPYKN
jgi:uncharacterized membrane protein YcaP (DUF421 family)